MLVCVDNGYDSTKVRTNNMITKFKSRIEKATGEHFEKDVIEYNGEKYIVGQGTDDISNDKTQGLVHKLCTLKALGDLTNVTQEFDLIVDLPLNHYRNKDARERFKEYIGEKINVIKQNGITKKIIINKCTVLPQGISALYSNPSAYKDKVIGIIDIGGLTIDGCIVEDLKPIKETIFTINKGVTILENRIKTLLNQYFFLNIQDYEMPYILKNGIPNREKESKAIIDNAIDEHFEGVLRELKAKNWSLETLELLGIGGGMITFKDVITKYLPNLKVSDNPVYANVNGLYAIGRMI